MLQPLVGDQGLNPRFWWGRVEDRADPLNMGRLRVRIFGFHTEDKSLIPTEDLPWAQVLIPANSVGVSGVGDSPNGAMIGTIVNGYWADGENMQEPIVLGAVYTVEGSGIITSPTDSSPTTGDSHQQRINDNSMGVPGNWDPGSGSQPPWVQVGLKEIGVKEIKGGQYNPRIAEYLSTVGLGRNDEIAWCSAFCAWCVKQSTGSVPSGVTGLAKSWLKAGRRVDKLQPGCFVVFNSSRGRQFGHVGMFIRTQGGRIMLLGGNQSDSVSVAGYSQDRVAGIVMLS